MDDSFIARLGYDPVRVYTHVHGHPPSPGGIFRLAPPAAAADSVAEERPPGADAELRAPIAPSGDGEATGPTDDPLPAAPSPAPPDQPTATSTAADQSPSPPSEAPLPDDRVTTIRRMREWLNEHWSTVEAMALAGEAPQRPVPAQPAPSGPAPPPRAVHVAPGDRWNKPKMAEFLRQLAATHSVTAAAKAVGMSRRSAYKLRSRLKGQPFDIAWEAAFRHGYDELAHAALELALEGEEVPHYYQGELKATHRKRNPQLMVQLLKLRNRAGAPMLGRYGAAAEFWSENWEQLVDRIATGSVTWAAESEALGEADRAALDLPHRPRQVDRIISRNLPDEPRGPSRG